MLELNRQVSVAPHVMPVFADEFKAMMSKDHSGLGKPGLLKWKAKDGSLPGTAYSLPKTFHRDHKLYSLFLRPTYSPCLPFPWPTCGPCPPFNSLLDTDKSTILSRNISLIRVRTS